MRLLNLGIPGVCSAYEDQVKNTLTGRKKYTFFSFLHDFVEQI